MTENDFSICHSLKQESEDLKYRLSVLKAQTDVFHFTLSLPTKQAKHTVDFFENIGKIERIWVEKIIKSLAHIQRVEEAIQALPRPESRTIMRLHYVDGLTWEQIENKTYLSRRQCIRLRDDAFTTMGIP